MGTLAGHRYVTRSEWGARNPTRRLTPFALPARRLYVHHTGAEAHGPAALRAIQRYHQDTRGWADIAYAYLIDDDGTIYEGRGHQFVGGATAGENATSHAICLLGNFQHRVPAAAAQTSLVDLTRHGAAARWWTPTMHGHRDSAGASTACPGDWLYQRLPALRSQLDRPTTPAPTPNTITEDDVFLYTSKGEPTFFCAAGQSVGLNEAADLAAFEGIPYFRLDDDTFAKFRRAFPGN